MDVLRNMFRALKHRNYAVFCSGQIISLIGNWMQAMAMSWLVYRLTGSSTRKFSSSKTTTRKTTTRKSSTAKTSAATRKAVTRVTSDLLKDLLK